MKDDGLEAVSGTVVRSISITGRNVYCGLESWEKSISELSKHVDVSGDAFAISRLAMWLEPVVLGRGSRRWFEGGSKSGIASSNRKSEQAFNGRFVPEMSRQHDSKTGKPWFIELELKGERRTKSVASDPAEWDDTGGNVAG